MNLCRQASQAIEDGYTIIVLSDRGVNAEWAPIPSLLATGAVHHHLIREGTRTKCGIVVESGEPREVMHFCLLVGYGAGAINPYLAYATMAGMIHDGQSEGRQRGRGGRAFHQGARQEPGQGRVEDGHLDRPELSRRADFRSDRAEQGSRRQVFHLDAVARRRRRSRRDRARSRRIATSWRTTADPNLDGELDVGGQYQWRRRGEFHMYNPNTIAKLQHAVRSGNYRLFKEYTRLVDDQAAISRPCAAC